ncbi:MAG: DUF1207 domain-containing protein [Nitrospiraceae bacterium]|nr:MAG: DUF1207 domain-containing protein [Nitrospiraceae bacterium]
MKKKVLFLFFMLFIIFSISTTVSASVDDYIRGYAEAILEREFNLLPDSLLVKEGIITIGFENIENVDRDRLIAELSRIRDVKRVEVVVIGKQQVTPLPVSEKKQEKISGEEKLYPAGITARMRDRLFEPLIADPRWPHFSIAYHYYIDDEELKNVGSTTFGETLPLYRDSAPFGGQWQIGIQAAVFAIFDLDTESMDLINADYWVGIPVSYRNKSFSSLFRLFHQSSHLGDEFLLRNRVDRVNLSYEAIDFRTSYDFSNSFRFYGGNGFVLRKEPEDLKRWSIQYGLEWESPGTYMGGAIKPVFGADIKNQEETDWRSDVSLRLGIEIESKKMLWNRLHLMLEYFNGNSPHGQFYERSIEYLGVGSHFYF